MCLRTLFSCILLLNFNVFHFSPWLRGNSQFFQFLSLMVQFCSWFSEYLDICLVSAEIFCMHSQNAKYSSCKYALHLLVFHIEVLLYQVCYWFGYPCRWIFLSRHEKRSDRSVQRWTNFMLLMLCLILFWHSIVFYITHIFLLGKRSGRSKKWKEMLKLPPVSLCEGIRCSIGRCPVEWSVWFFLRSKGKNLVVLTERILSCFWMLISKKSY